MAGEQATKSKAGSSTGFTLGSGLVAQEAVDRLMMQGRLIGDALLLTNQKVVALGIAYKTATERAAQGSREWLTALDSIHRNLTNQMTAVEKLTGLYQGLGNAMQSAKLPAGQVGAPDHGRTVIGASNTVLQAAGKTVVESASYQDVVNDIAIKGQKDPNQREKARQDISKKVTKISNDTGMGKAQVAELIREMLNSGLDLNQSLELAPLAAQFSKGQGVSAQDTAALFRSMAEGNVSSSDDVRKVLNQMIAQAKDGKVGIADVTQMMPRIMAAMIARKSTGAENAIRAAQMLQHRGNDLGSNAQISADVEHDIVEGALPKVEKKGDTDYVTEDLKSRREGSAQIQGEMGAAFSRLSINIGDALSPLSDNVFKAVTVTVNAFADLVQAGGKWSTALGVLVLAVTSAISAFGAIRAGKELWGAGKAVFGPGDSEAKQGGGSWIKRMGSRLLGTDDPSGSSATGQPAGNTESKVFVVNWPQALTQEPGKDAAARPKGRGKIDVVVKNWPRSLADKSEDVSAPAKGKSDKDVAVKKRTNALARQDRNETSKVVPASNGNKPTRVIVLNWPNNGPYGRDDGTKEKRRRRGRTRNDAGKPGRGAKRPEDHSDQRPTRGGKTGQPPVSEPLVRPPARPGSSGLASHSSVGFAGNGGSPLNLGSAGSSEPLVRPPARPGSSGPASHSSVSFAGNGGSSLNLGAAGSVGSRAAGTFGKVASFARSIPGGRYFDAGMKALETFQNAETQDEKAEGYGAAAGNLGGTLVGGTVGAALGTVLIPIPGVGTAIGAMVGSTLGGMVGEDVGGQLGKFLFGSKDKAKAEGTAPAAGAASPGPAPVVGSSVGTANQHGQAVPTPVTTAQANAALTQPAVEAQGSAATTPVSQYFTISPSIPINVQGTIADPADLVRQLAPEIQRLFAELAAQANRANQMWDTPATTYAA